MATAQDQLTTPQRSLVDLLKLGDDRVVVVHDVDLRSGQNPRSNPIVRWMLEVMTQRSTIALLVHEHSAVLP